MINTYNVNDLKRAINYHYCSLTWKNNTTNCILHQDKTPSLSVKDGDPAFFHCFSCGMSGDLWKLWMLITGCDFKEAVQDVKNKLNIDHPSTNINIKPKLNVMERHRSKIDWICEKQNLKFVTSYEYSPIHFKHRLIDSKGKKTLRHTYYIPEENTVVFSKDKLPKDTIDSLNYIYKKDKITYKISNNEDIYICEGEKDADNVEKLGFASCHIETGKEYQLNEILDKNMNYIGRIFFIYDNDINFTGLDRALEMSSKINYSSIYLIEPREKDISDDIDMYGETNTKFYIQSTTEDQILAFKDYQRGLKYTKVKNKMVIAPSTDNIEKMLYIKKGLKLYTDVITGIKLEISKYIINLVHSLPSSNSYGFADRVSTDTEYTVDYSKVRKMIKCIFERNKINLFDIKIKKFMTKESSEFNRFFNDFYKCLDQEFTSKEEFMTLITFFFTRTVQRAKDCRKRPNKVLKMVLTLIGGQSIGKSHFVKHIFDKMDMYEFLGLNKSFNNSTKDDIINMTDGVIIELAESTKMLRSPKYADELKNFISKDADVYRKAYAESSEIHPRVSSYIYTTNNNHILNDSTGNTRFFAIKIEKRLPSPEDYDMKKVWGYIYYLTSKVTNENIREFYDIPEILINYLDKNNDCLFDVSNHLEELLDMETVEDSYSVYNQSDLCQILNITNSKEKFRLFDSMKQRDIKLTSHKIDNKKTKWGYKLKTLLHFKEKGFVCFPSDDINKPLSSL